jgi:excisionase family DNA binding protein
MGVNTPGKCFSIGSNSLRIQCGEVIAAMSAQQTRKAIGTMLRRYPDILDIKQVAEILGVSKKTVYGLVTRDRLQYIKVGREYRVPKAAIIRLFTDMSVSPSLSEK